MSDQPLQSDTALSRGRIRGEILLVLGVSLGADAVYAIINIVDLSTRAQSLGHQSTAINTPLSDRQYIDLSYQLYDILIPLIPVALVCYILWQTARPHLARLGFDFRRPWLDTGAGIALAAIIGAGGIGVYLAGRALQITVSVSADSLNAYWWTIPVLLLSALRAALQEEFIVIGYLYYRLRQLGWSKWTIILSTAVFRGSYHLYQGWGSFVGNFIMGVIFGWLYTRYGRLLPFIVAHFLIDAATFVGYGWAHAAFPTLF
ncbi:MAG TPA: type II CAAX endopeptidase family protein [Galbitalea sp.]|jgi:membrane protease YdiL (CAAX protease family)|nr:type II CAAX endopeptidase family protein [Galbitalea sp.]